MDAIKPNTFNCDADNLSEEWKTFKQGMKFYMLASEKSTKADNVKTSLLLNCMGKDIIQV